MILASLEDVKKYTKNLGKSIGFATLNTLNSKAPIFKSLKDTNQDTIKTWLNDLRDLRNSSNRTESYMSRNPLFQAGSKILENLKKDLKTGKWYTDSDEMDSMMNEMFGIDDLESELDNSLNEDDSLDSLNAAPDNTTLGDTRQAKIISKTVIGGSQTVANSVVSGSSYIGETVKNASKLSYLQLSKTNLLLSDGFGNITLGLKNIIDFNNNAVKTHIENSTKFFENTTQLLTKQNAMLEEMLEMQRNLYKNEQESQNSTPSNRYSSIFGYDGTLDLKALVNNIKNNISKSSGFFGDMFQGPMVDQMFAHPMEYVMQGIISSLMGKKLNNSITNLGKTVQGIGGTSLAKLKNKSKNGSFIASIIEGILGIDTSENTKLDLSKYNKGPIPFNGIANKSLVEVIPAYLARIESALTGQSERIFDFNSGRWTNKKSIQEDIIKTRNSNIYYAMSDVTSEFRSKLSNIKFNKKEDKDTLRADISKVYKYLWENDGYIGDLLVDNTGKISDRNLYKRIGVSSARNLDIIAALLSQVSNSTKMNIAGNVMLGKDKQNKTISSYQSGGEYAAHQSLFNGAYGTFDTKDIYKKFSNDPLKNNNAIVDILKAIHKQVTISRYILETKDNITRRTTKKKLSKKGINNTSVKTPDWDTKYDNEFSRTIGVPTDNSDKSKINTNDYIYDSYINTSNDANIDFESNDILNQITSSIGDELGIDLSVDNEAKDAYNSYKGKNVFEKLRNAEGWQSKFGVINAFMANLKNTPTDFLANVISKVDDTIYDFFYGKDTERVDEHGNKIKGFFNNMIYDAEKSFNKLTEVLEKKFVDPLKKLLDKISKSDAVKDIKERAKGLAKGALSGIKNSFSKVFSINGSKATGDAYIPETGLYALSKGEMVIPSTMNPYNPFRTDIKTDAQNEKRVIDQARKGRFSIKGSYAEGTKPGAFSRFSTLLEYFGIINPKEDGVIDKLKENFKNDLKKTIPDLSLSTLGGGALGVAALGPIGLFVGSILGAGLSIAHKSESIKETLFGKDNKNGTHKEGIFDGPIVNSIKKYWPDIKDHAIVGGSLGIMSGLVGGPLGLLGGMAIGGVVGYLRKNTELQETLFGKGGFKLPEKLKKFFGDHKERAIAGAGLGATLGGLALGGPVGLIGGALLGSTVSYLTTTDTFTDTLLGKKNKDGKREGGVIESIKKVVIDPLAERAKDARQSFDKYLKSHVFEPIKEGIKPMLKLTRVTITNVARRIGSAVIDSVKSPKLRLFREKFMSQFMKTKKAGALGGFLAGTAMFGPVWGLAAAGLGAVAMSDTSKNISSKVINFIPNLIKKAGRSAQASLISSGDETEKTAMERLDFMAGVGKKNYKNKAFDELLASSNKEQLKEISDKLKVYNKGEKGAKELLNKFDNSVIDGFSKFDIGWNKSKAVLNLIKTKINTNKDKAAIEMGINKILEGSSNLTYEDRKNLVKFALVKNEEYQMISSGASDIKSVRNNIAEQLKKFGIDLAKVDSKKLQKLAEVEANSREETQEDPIKAADRNTDRLVEIISQGNMIQSGILKLMSGQELSNEEVNNINNAIKVNNSSNNSNIAKLDAISGDRKSLMTDAQVSGLKTVKSYAENQIYKRDSKWNNLFNNNLKVKFDENSKTGERLKSKLIEIGSISKNNSTLDAINFAYENAGYTPHELQRLLTDSRMKWNKKSNIKKYNKYITEFAKAGLKVGAYQLSTISDDDWGRIKSILGKIKDGKFLCNKSEWITDQTSDELKDTYKLIDKNPSFIFTSVGIDKIKNTPGARYLLDKITSSCKDKKFDKEYIISLFYGFLDGKYDTTYVMLMIDQQKATSILNSSDENSNNEDSQVEEGKRKVIEKISKINKNENSSQTIKTPFGTVSSNAIKEGGTPSERIADAIVSIATDVAEKVYGPVANSNPELSSAVAANSAGGYATEYGFVTTETTTDGSIKPENNLDNKEILEKQERADNDRHRMADALETIANGKGGNVFNSTTNNNSSKTKNSNNSEDDDDEDAGIIDSVMAALTGIAGFSFAGLGAKIGKKVGTKIRNVVTKSKMFKRIAGLGAILGSSYLLGDFVEGMDEGNEEDGKKSGDPMMAAMGIGGYLAYKSGKIKNFLSSKYDSAKDFLIKRADMAKEYFAKKANSVKEGLKSVKDKVIEIAGNYKDKIAQSAMVQNATKWIQEKIIAALTKISSFLTKISVGPLSWLGPTFNKGASALIKRMCTPESLARIAKKVGIKAGFWGAQAAGLATSGGLLNIAITAAQVSWFFYDGFKDAGRYFNTDDPSFAQQIVAGSINAILGLTPLGLVIDGGDVLELFKPFLPSSVFGDGYSGDKNNEDEDSSDSENDGLITGAVKKVGNAISSGIDAAKNWLFGKDTNTNSGSNNPPESGREGNSGQGKWGRGVPGQFNSQLDPSNAMGFNAPGDTISQTMRDSGCGPVSAVNAASALGVGADPKTAASYALAGGYKEKDGGTKPGFFSDYLGQMGIGTKDISGSNKDIMNNLASGNPVILMGQDGRGVNSKNPYGPGPHYVTATGIDSDGNIIIQDPESTKGNKVYKANDVLNKSSIAIATGRGKWGRGIKYTLRTRFGREKRQLSADIPETIWNYLTGNGLDDYTTAAIMGNIYAESGYNPGATNPNSNAYGICQWLGSRYDNLVSVANEQGVDPGDLNAQLTHLWNELNGEESAALKDTKEYAAKKDLESAVEVFCRDFERPSEAEIQSSLGKRYAAAKDALDKKGKGIVIDGSYDTAGPMSSKLGSSKSSSSSGFFGMLDSISNALDISNLFGFGKYGRGDNETSENTETKTDDNKSSDSNKYNSSSINAITDTMKNGAISEIGSIGKKISSMGSKLLGSYAKDIFGIDFFSGQTDDKKKSNSSGSNGNASEKYSGQVDKGSALEYVMNSMPGAQITEAYGVDRGSYIHAGTDIGADAGTPIKTPVSGTVYDLGTQPGGGGFGNYIQIKDKNNNYHIFPHITTWNDNLSKGSTVKKGDIVAWVGSTGHSTGPHLHYEIDPPSNPDALGPGAHLDPGKYDISGLGKTNAAYNKLRQRIKSNNEKAYQYIDSSSKKKVDVPYGSEAVGLYGKGLTDGASLAVSNTSSQDQIDYNNKFDAMIAILQGILEVLKSGSSGGSNISLTPAATFSGGATNIGESFPRKSIEDIVSSMNSIARK